MDTAIKPIITSTSLSLLLHGVAVAGLLLSYDQWLSPDAGVGNGVDVHLISSVRVSEQQETEVPRKQETHTAEAVGDLLHTADKHFAEQVLTAMSGMQPVAVTEPEDRRIADVIPADEVPVEIRPEIQQQVDSSESVSSVAQSTDASQQQHSIIELLHRRISDNKEYPYLARRQRREGVATVAFVLHPDGRIEDAQLVTSSHARSLDRAALSAVKKIAPFDVAQEYLQQSERFQVDIEFDLL